MKIRPFHFSSSLALLVAGCTLVADFSDPVDDDESPDGATEMTPEAGSIIVDASATDSASASDTGTTTTDSPVTTTDTGPTGPCDGKKNGEHVEGETRCCNGQPTLLTTDSNCGACGIDCRTDLGHHCQYVLNKFWTCTGCAVDGGGGSGGCFTGCCSTAASGSGYCSPETVCGLAVPICSDSPCEGKSPGSSCQDSFPFEPPHCGY